MSLNALDAALLNLAKASTALERQANPSVKAVEESLTAAKDAAKLLKAALDLMEEGIYSVARDTPFGRTAMRTPPEAEAHLAKRVREVSEIDFTARMAWEAAEMLLLDALKTVREQMEVKPCNLVDLVPSYLRRLA